MLTIPSMIRFSLPLILILFTHAIYAETDPVISVAEGIEKRDGLKTASVGFCMIPLDGEPSAAKGYRMDTGLVPASTMKAITTATANEVLGPEFRFKTEIQLAGKLAEDGTLTGDVVIRGGGDPTLGDSGIANDFSKWESALREAGVKKVEGSIVGDASLFGTQMVPDSWQRNDIGNYYGAGACGLTFHQNLFYCSFRTPKVGGIAPFVGTDPKLPEVEFFNEMRVGSSGSGDQGYIYGVPYAKVYYLRGTVPAGSGSFTIKGSIPDPAFFCARAFTKYLNENGIEVSGEPTTDRLLGHEGKTLSARKVISEQESDTLASLMVLTNQKSNNLRAECMHRMVGVEKEGKGTTKAASEAVTDFWGDKGVDMSGYYMADGCGLSRANSVTARQMAGILYHAAKGEHFESFRKSLPVAGQSGTLRSIGRGTSAEGRVRAKSGTIDRVKCYAGYVTARSGKVYSFAIFVNNYEGYSSQAKSAIVDVWVRMVGM